MKKSIFFIAYWPVVLLGCLMALPRLYIQPPDWSDHVVHFMGRLVLEETPLLLSAIVLFSGLGYWFFEYLGYRFNFLLKTVHLVLTYPVLLIVAAEIYLNHYEEMRRATDAANVTMYRIAEWRERLGHLLPTASVMFVAGQGVGFFHWVVVLMRGRGIRMAGMPEILDQPD